MIYYEFNLIKNQGGQRATESSKLKKPASSAGWTEYLRKTPAAPHPARDNVKKQKKFKKKL